MLLSQNIKKQGFTIVEIVIVIIVIGILAAVSIIGYGAWRSSVATKVVKSDLNQAIAAMENARTFDEEGYPSTLPTTIEASDTVQLSGGGRPGGKSYCIQASSTEVSSVQYYVSSKQKTPTQGNCTITNALSAGTVGTGGYQNGAALSATFSRVEAVVADANGTIYVSDGDHLRRITKSGVVSSYNGTGADGFTTGAAGAQVFQGARGIALDSAGNIYVIAINDDSIFKISPTGVKTTLNNSIHGTDLILGSDNMFYALEGDNWSGKLFSVTMAGVATHVAGNATNASIDGQGTAASFHDPRALTRTSDGTIYVCDLGTGKVRKVTKSYYVSTYAGPASAYPGGATKAINGDCHGLTVDDSDVLYVAAGTKLQAIDKNGTVTDIASISNDTLAVAFDNDENIIVPAGQVIYKVTIP